MNWKYFNRPKYRIVTDSYLGFEAQIKSWFWPFWRQLDGCNTSPSIEVAEERIRKHAKKHEVVKYVDV